MRRSSHVGRALTVGLGALVAVTAAIASGAATPVSLTLVGPADREPGQAATLVATAKLPTGAHLLIQRAAGKKKAAKVVECRRSPCRGSFRDTKVEDVRFQALAIKRTGAKTAILGRSHPVTVSWLAPASEPPTTVETPPPPPPPPTPAATPGHYEGKTADNELFAFDIGATGLTLTNLQTGQINEHCEPPLYLSGGNLRAGGPYPVAFDGAFTISGSITGSVDGSPSTENVTITGHVTGGSASGTYREETSLTLQNGTGYNCTTGDQTWTAAKV